MTEIGHFVCPDVTKPLNIYTHATTFQGIVYVSGVQGFIPGTFEFPSDDPEEQSRQVMKNLSAILHTAGSDMPHVIKVLAKCFVFIDFKYDGCVDRSIQCSGPFLTRIAVNDFSEATLRFSEG